MELNSRWPLVHEFLEFLELFWNFLILEMYLKKGVAVVAIGYMVLSKVHITLGDGQMVTGSGDNLVIKP